MTIAPYANGGHVVGRPAKAASESWEGAGASDGEKERGQRALRRHTGLLQWMTSPSESTNLAPLRFAADICWTFSVVANVSNAVSLCFP